MKQRPGIRPRLSVGLLRHLNPEETGELLIRLLELVVLANQAYLRAHPDTPHPYQAAGLKYAREPKGSEEWLGIEEILAAGQGDCEDLACYLCAWELVHNPEGRCAIVLQQGQNKQGRLGYHVLVRLADGTLEDPSKKLGMGA